jgi:putative DNA primase/helicase
LHSQKTEKDWRAGVEAALPETFAALLDALSAGLKRQEETATPRTRMADFARFVVAAELALPWESGAFLKAYESSRLHSSAPLADGDVVATAIISFMEDKNEWTGLMSALYAKLSDLVSLDIRRSKEWPGNARWFGDRMRRAAPTLRDLGIWSNDKHTEVGTSVSLGKIASVASNIEKGVD